MRNQKFFLSREQNKSQLPIMSNNLPHQQFNVTICRGRDRQDRASCFIEECNIQLHLTTMIKIPKILGNLIKIELAFINKGRS